jgi:hypothetical protein
LDFSLSSSRLDSDIISAGSGLVKYFLFVVIKNRMLWYILKWRILLNIHYEDWVEFLEVKLPKM